MLVRKAAGVVALLGGLVVLLTDFGGWYSREVSMVTETGPSMTGSGSEFFYSFRGSDATGAINLFAMPYGLLLLVVAALLGLTAYLALRPPPKPPLPVWIVPAGAAALTVLFGLIFVAVMLIEDPTDWWLDTGFFAGLLAGGAAAFVLAREQLKRA